MKFFLKFSLLVILTTATASALAYFLWYEPKFKSHSSKNFSLFKKAADHSSSLVRLKQKATLAADYVKEHNYNTTFCFLVDMRVTSGLNRFFVYGLQNDSVKMAGLVAHGSGTGNSGDVPDFSNTPNSNCTSLGRYRVGKPYQGRFGLAYKLYGLDESNSNAFNRFVVLHSHSCVPNEEVDPQPICESWGCPTVAPPFLMSLKKYIDNSRQPLLLWIYY